MNKKSITANSYESTDALLSAIEWIAMASSLFLITEDLLIVFVAVGEEPKT